MVIMDLAAGANGTQVTMLAMEGTTSDPDDPFWDKYRNRYAPDPATRSWPASCAPSPERPASAQLNGSRCAPDPATRSWPGWPTPGVGARC
jgi:hypothetical protein